MRLACGFAIIGFLLGSSFNNVRAQEDFEKASIGFPARQAVRNVLKIYTPSGSGSGVVISVPGISDLVITAWHVLKDISPSEAAEIRFPGGKILKINPDLFVSWPGKDVAILPIPKDFQLEFKKNFQGARLARDSSIRIGSQVAVAGFPLETESIESSSLRVSTGIIQSLPIMTNALPLVGYSSKTLPGMSGGGVFSSTDGSLIALHIRGERSQNESSNSLETPAKTGTNFGVPAGILRELLEKNYEKQLSTASPLDDFRKGTYLMDNKRFAEAYNIFKNLFERYPNSLVAEWAFQCSKNRSMFPKGRRTYEWYKKFQSSRGVKPYYDSGEMISDIEIWKEKDRYALLQSDPLFKQGQPSGNDFIGQHMAINALQFKSALVQYGPKFFETESRSFCVKYPAIDDAGAWSSRITEDYSDPKPLEKN